jgi:hypothetical protein
MPGGGNHQEHCRSCPTTRSETFSIWEKSISGRGNSKCKGPEAGAMLDEFKRQQRDHWGCNKVTAVGDEVRKAMGRE